jgi:Ca-activated chloride channel homolog
MLYSFFDNPKALTLLVVLIVVTAVIVVGERIRRRRLRLWAASLFAFRPTRFRLVSLGLLLVGLGLLVVGIAGPKWGLGDVPEVTEGRDLVCVLDASRSMLAEDVLPNRFERAKAALAELSRSIQKRGGHRLGLVVFAARAKIVCPPTRDYDHFRDALAQLDTKELLADLRPPAGTSPSGTRIGGGLKAAVDAHSEQNKGFQDILLISDGDDPARDAEWRNGVQAARSAGIPVHVVGVGDPANGHPIPGRDGTPIRHDREVVLTRLEERLLETIARQTGGSYLPARMEEFALGPWFEKQIASKRMNVQDEDLLTVKKRQYPWFLGLALLVLGADMVLVRARVKKT